ncbi:MAG: DUF58 domain-containing protein [Gemmatimonadaceae bacterium]
MFRSRTPVREAAGAESASAATRVTLRRGLRPPAPAASSDAIARDRAARTTPSKDILRQVKLLELRTRGLVNSLFVGEYRSVFKGQGMEFSEVREYQPGDEVRSIDWNVTARMGRPYVKRYIEERELTVMLAVDLSGSEQFGTVRRFKSEAASELAAVLAMSAVRNNDRVGIVLFTDRIEHVVPPRKGRRHVLRIIRDLLAFEPQGIGTDISGTLEYISRMLSQKSIIFVVSDFLAPGIEHPLKLLAQRHDVVAVTIEDPGERDLPDVGLARFIDPETGETLSIDTSSGGVRTAYATAVSAEREERKHLLRRLAIDEIAISTPDNVVHPLIKFFRTRETRARRR